MRGRRPASHPQLSVEEQLCEAVLHAILSTRTVDVGELGERTAAGGGGASGGGGGGSMMPLDITAYQIPAPITSAAATATHTTPNTATSGALVEVTGDGKGSGATNAGSAVEASDAFVGHSASGWQWMQHHHAAAAAIAPRGVAGEEPVCSLDLDYDFGAGGNAAVAEYTVTFIPAPTYIGAAAAGSVGPIAGGVADGVTASSTSVAASLHAWSTGGAGGSGSGEGGWGPALHRDIVSCIGTCNFRVAAHPFTRRYRVHFASSHPGM
jgi:hypothetical protein